jgi:uncharacterized protein
MKIYVKAKPRSKKEYIKKIDNNNYTVAVSAPPISGKANLAITESLSEYFKIPVSQIILISGKTLKQKIFDLPISEEDLEMRDQQKKLF